jgi:hypothetical protein
MAKRNSARRARSRKRRPAASGANDQARGRAATTTQLPSERLGERRSAASAPVAKRPRPGDPHDLGERPQAPWHPLPLSELLILVGIVGVIVGLSRSTPTTALAGVGAVLLGTAEVSWREHRGGFRAHTLLLALLPTVVFHTVVILLASAFISVPRAVNFALLPVDIALALFLYKLLRIRFEDARRERRFAAGR